MKAWTVPCLVAEFPHLHISLARVIGSVDSLVAMEQSRVASDHSHNHPFASLETERGEHRFWTIDQREICHP
jgi:hypothetical protein